MQYVRIRRIGRPQVRQVVILFSVMPSEFSALVLSFRSPKVSGRPPTRRSSGLAGATGAANSVSTPPKASIPAEALSNKLRFLAKREHEREDFKAQANEMGKLPLERVAELYFNWKAASSSPRTIERERRIFAQVIKFFSRKLPICAIMLPLIREYQHERRQHVSKNMKQPVTGRTANYEMHLLRGMMIFADCWTDSLAARYTPLRQIKKRVGKVAEKVRDSASHKAPI